MSGVYVRIPAPKCYYERNQRSPYSAVPMKATHKTIINFAKNTILQTVYYFSPLNHAISSSFGPHWLTAYIKSHL